jgi:hypothetical protein
MAQRGRDESGRSDVRRKATVPPSASIAAPLRASPSRCSRWPHGSCDSNVGGLRDRLLHPVDGDACRPAVHRPDRRVEPRRRSDVRLPARVVGDHAAPDRLSRRAPPELLAGAGGDQFWSSAHLRLAGRLQSGSASSSKGTVGLRSIASRNTPGRRSSALAVTTLVTKCGSAQPQNPARARTPGGGDKAEAWPPPCALTTPAPTSCTRCDCERHRRAWR